MSLNHLLILIAKISLNLKKSIAQYYNLNLLNVFNGIFRKGVIIINIQKIKKINQEQLSKIIDIWREENIYAHNFIDSQYWIANQNMVAKALKEANIYIAEEQDEIIGFAGLQGLYLAGIFVRRPYQKQGIGSQIMVQIKHDFKKVTLSVYEKNKTAYQFYQRQDFHILEKKVEKATNEIEYTMSWSR